MTRPCHPAAGAALAALACAAAPALADVTADQVWQAWQATVTASGGALTADSRRTGDRLVLTNLSWQPELATDARLRVNSLVLQDQPDGSVRVVLPARFPVTVVPDPAKHPVAVGFTVATTGLDITIRGLGDLLEFQAAAGSVSLALDEASLKRAEVEADIFAALAAADLSLRWKQDLVIPEQSLDSAVSLGTLHAEILVDTPQDGKGTLVLDLADLSGHLRGRIPASAAPFQGTEGPAPDVARMLAIVQDGMFLDAELRHGDLAVLIDVVDPAQGPVLFDLAATSGESRLRADKTEILSESLLDGTRLKVRNDDPTLPFDELEFSLSEYRTLFRTGVGDAVSPQPWTVLFRMTDLSLSDATWAAIGPLPRDPMALALGLSGTWALKPEALATGYLPSPDETAPPPIVADNLSLDNFLLRGLGAEVTGSGALTFDLTDTVTFDGLPAPTGKLSFAARGVNELLGRLRSMGALTEDELAGARFGLLAISKAAGGAEVDRLTSELEFRDKSFWLNGQKVK